ncbi:XerC Integrase [Candidatus Nanopelagicaceae bacterium]
MASINDRWWVTKKDGTKSKSDRHQVGLRWQVRYRNAEGQGRNKSFEKRVDAERFMASVSVELHQGTYIDRITSSKPFELVAESWLVSRVVDINTYTQNELHIRRHMLPRWGKTQIGSIKTSQIQEWISSLSKSELSSQYVRLIFANFKLILDHAVADNLIATNPSLSKSIKLPAKEKKKLEVMSTEQVTAILNAFPSDLRLIPLIGATCGLRQGELFGLRIQDFDLENSVIHVRQQIKVVGYKPIPALPKGKKTRSVPMPEYVRDQIAAFLEACEPLEGERNLEPTEAGIIFTFRERKPINKNYFNTSHWEKTLKAAGVPKMRSTGMHGLRHYCASTWLESGVSIKAVSEYLGHADAGFTLRTYTHLLGNTDTKARMSFSAFEGN